MASNALERAVIAAARRWANGLPSSGHGQALIQAVQRLEAWERQQDPIVTEVGWHELAEGDLLRSAKSGRFFAVTKTLKVKAGYSIEVQGAPKPFIRPTPAEPTAWIKRGPTGSAVDTLTHVFSSS